MSKVKVVRCSDAGYDCTFEARSESEEDLLAKVAKHAETVHHTEVNDEMIKKVKSIIYEE